MTAKTYSEPGRGEIRIGADDAGKVLIYMQEAQQDGISQPMEFVRCAPPPPFLSIPIIVVKSKSGKEMPLLVSQGEYAFIQSAVESSE